MDRSHRARSVVYPAALAAAMLVAGFGQGRARAGQPELVGVPLDSAGCVQCHELGRDDSPGTPGIVAHWRASTHAAMGVGCVDCHGVPAPDGAEPIENPRYVVVTTWDKASDRKQAGLAELGGAPVERPDIWTHGGTQIVSIVSPRACARCHPSEADEFFHSRHATAAQFIGSIDNFLGRFAEGPAAANSGCQQCHGSSIEIARPARDAAPPAFAADAWPNTGIGRVNPDGAWGACSACHSRHEFSSGMARRPENCGKCHLGPDHPQAEIYNESKHGIAYRRNEGAMHMDNPPGEWTLGRDYVQAPTCATCHMGAVAPTQGSPGLPLTHDAGARISWTLRPSISVMPAAITDAEGDTLRPEPQERRADMQRVCLTCHGRQWVGNFYVQYDQAVDLYNEKFARPATAIYDFMGREQIIDAVPMNEEMDFVYFELWHHEGRRARHGASMMAPDYVQWNGFYELSRNFYTRFLPLARKLAGEAGKGEAMQARIEQSLHGPDGSLWETYHRWTEGLTPAQKAAMLDWEQGAYRGKQ
jgi:hydroxylamine dehydrogenase